MVTRTQHLKQNTQTLDVLYMGLGLSQKRTRKTAVVSEQQGIERVLEEVRLGLVCHKKRRTVEKAIETQQELDGET